MPTNPARFLVRSAAGLALVTFAGGFAYLTNSTTALPLKWPAGTIAMKILADNSADLSDDTTRATSIQAAMLHPQRGWNHYLGAVQFAPQIAPAGSGADNNGVNEIFFSSSPYNMAWDANTLAVTTAWSRGNQRTEADIILNQGFTWDSYRGARQTGKVDLQRIVLHELGHVLGLDHPDQATPAQSVSAVMNSHVSDTDSLTADDIAGGQSLYGPPGIPVNNGFAAAAAISLVGNTAQLTGFNTNATKETGEPNHGANPGGRSVWWTWTAPSAGSLTVSTQGSVFDTTLGVYTGSSVAALTTVAANDDVQAGIIQSSTVTLTVIGGATYAIAVDGFNAADGNGADSGAVKLTVTFTPVASPPPAITSQPSSQTATLGGSVTFTVAASGSPTGYQWNFGGIAISGATSSTFTLANVQAANAGAYTVTVTNASGSVTSTSATLGLLASPVLSESVASGHTVSFSVTGAAGSVQWQVSTDGGTTWTNLANDATYGGATTSALTITAATAAMSGYKYRSVMTAGGSLSTSNPATLTVVAALLGFPAGIAADAAGNLYVADASLEIIQKISPSGQMSTLAGSSGLAGAVDGTGATARLNQPGGITASAAGFLTVADTANATIRTILADGTVMTLAGSPTNHGHLDGVGTAATFASPIGIAQDAGGTLYVADAMNHAIRKITASGVVTTLAGSAGNSGSADGTGAAARFNYPTGVAVDASGNVYVADTTNNLLRKISPAGVVTTLAGVAGVSGAQDGTGSGALFNQPGGLAVDGAGNLYLNDTGNSTVRRITPAGVVTTIVGLPGIAGFKDGTGTDAWLNQPKAVALDSGGNLFIADTGNAAIRKVTTAGVSTTLDLTPAPASGSSGSTGSTGTTTPSAPSGTSSSGGGGGGGGALGAWFGSALGLLGLLRWRMRSK